MGTSGAFGGSGAAAWDKVRSAWEAMGSAGGDGAASTEAPPPSAVPDVPAAAESPSAYDSLISAIADALIGEDPDARRRNVPTVPRAQTMPSPRRGRQSGGSSGGGGSASGGSGRASAGRRITGQAARGGNAIGAAVAYRNRDVAGLADFGLSLDELDALSPRMRFARILDVAIGQAGHPDEQAMRQASLEQIKALLSAGTDGARPTGMEALRDFISELTVRIGLIELRDQVLAKTVSPKQAQQRETGLRQWVSAKVQGIDLGQYGRVSTRDFHQVARQMSADVLRLLRGTQ
ncbi:hypothetical protein GCM10025866_11520 [Naasia aerilata]|uniref:Uncharacterized protein n=1 Tax=Naasia aerilata TaxID=1162966 RepID=A0ABN6XM46_9MICO|nr:hypothetical protein GCM10025866_11520 [Naasia aerilata]